MKTYSHIGKELFIELLIVAFFNMILSGCYTNSYVAKEDYSSAYLEKVVTLEDSIIDFTKSDLKRAYVDGNEFVYFNRDGTQEKIPFEIVKAAYYEQFNLPLTLVCIGAGAYALLWAFVKFVLAGKSFGG
ncbi:MAG: hypothetical protein V1720_16220 [bacterium]